MRLESPTFGSEGRPVEGDAALADLRAGVDSVAVEPMAGPEAPQTAFEVGRHLIEGMKNPTVVRGMTALAVFPTIRPMGVIGRVKTGH